jgi:predicted nucleic acid-binding protein
MQKLVIDANVLIRFLRADHPEHFQRARSLFQEAEIGNLRLVLLSSVLAEVVYVLTSVYQCERSTLHQTLEPFLVHGGIECPEKEVLQDAMQRFAATNLDYMDCYIAAYSVANQLGVSSFDRDFRKFADVDWNVPGGSE